MSHPFVTQSYQLPFAKPSWKSILIVTQVWRSWEPRWKECVTNWWLIITIVTHLPGSGDLSTEDQSTACLSGHCRQCLSLHQLSMMVSKVVRARLTLEILTVRKKMTQLDLASNLANESIENLSLNLTRAKMLQSITAMQSHSQLFRNQEEDRCLAGTPSQIQHSYLEPVLISQCDQVIIDQLSMVISDTMRYLCSQCSKLRLSQSSRRTNVNKSQLIYLAKSAARSKNLAGGTWRKKT